jgi:hypothetical protein
MKYVLLSIASFWAVSSFDVEEGKPPASDLIGTARWTLNHTSWGILATTSIHLEGAAFGNPISYAEVGGVPYFYVSMMDASIQDLQEDSRCTLSLSEASIDCARLKLDAEDPRCIRLSLSGRMINVSDKKEIDDARAALFEVHPAMKSWPKDHSWLVQKLQIEKIFLVAKFGGPADISVADYLSAPSAKQDHPGTAAHEPVRRQPLFTEKAATARWLVHESDWATMVTTSVHLNGTAFGNPVSIVDGPQENSTGVPYMLISTLDISTEDLLKNDTCTLTFSQAEINCGLHGITGAWDPEDPRCTRLSLTGRIEGVKDPDEKVFAEKALVSKHSVMKQWLGLGDFHVVKLNIARIWLIDFFGGASDVAVGDYFKISNGFIQLSRPLFTEYV